MKSISITSSTLLGSSISLDRRLQRKLTKLSFGFKLLLVTLLCVSILLFLTRSSNIYMKRFVFTFFVCHILPNCLLYSFSLFIFVLFGLHTLFCCSCWNYEICVVFSLLQRLWEGWLWERICSWTILAIRQNPNTWTARVMLMMKNPVFRYRREFWTRLLKIMVCLHHFTFFNAVCLFYWVFFIFMQLSFPLKVVQNDVAINLLLYICIFYLSFQCFLLPDEFFNFYYYLGLRWSD